MRFLQLGSTTAFVLLQLHLVLLSGALRPRQNAGDSDNDSDSDSDSESCVGRICTTNHSGGTTRPTNTKTTTTNTKAGANHTPGGSSMLTTATGTLLQSSSSTTASPNPLAGDSKPVSGSQKRSGLGAGGIVGIVLGLGILAGLAFMLFSKYRSHRRELSKRPRGTMTLPSTFLGRSFSARPTPNHRQSRSESTTFLGPTTDMANVPSLSFSSVPTPTPLLPLISHPDGQPNEHHASLDPETGEALHSRQMTSAVPGGAPSSSWITRSPPTSPTDPSLNVLPPVPVSALHSDMHQYQKALEVDQEKQMHPEASGSATRTPETDPPPTYST